MNSLGYKLRYLLLSMLLFFIIDASAQYKKNKSSITGRKFSTHKKIGRKKPFNYINSVKLIGGLGTSLYYGELCDGAECISPKLNFSVGGLYRLNENISIRAEFLWYKIQGADKGDNVLYRNLSFYSNNQEINVVGIYDIIHYDKMYRRRSFVAPYVYAGLGLTFYNPKVKLANGDKVALRPLMHEGKKYGPAALVIPIGLGLNFKVLPHLVIGAESGWRFTFTDYLDDVSNKYDPTSTSDLADRRDEIREVGPIDSETTYKIYKPGEPGYEEFLKRGNPKRNDAYFISQIKVAYTLKVTKQTYDLSHNSSRFRIINAVKKR